MKTVKSKLYVYTERAYSLGNIDLLGKDLWWMDYGYTSSHGK